MQDFSEFKEDINTDMCLGDLVEDAAKQATLNIVNQFCMLVDADGSFTVFIKPEDVSNEPDEGLIIEQDSDNILVHFKFIEQLRNNLMLYSHLKDELINQINGIEKLEKELSNFKDELKEHLEKVDNASNS